LTPLLTTSQSLLTQLAVDNRIILVPWRALIYLRRATFTVDPTQRRWSALPTHLSDLYPTLRHMHKSGELQPITGLKHTYRVDVPYARNTLIDERELLLELHPYATISHATALVFHGLTNDQPTNLVATIPTGSDTAALQPIGTAPEDWEGIAAPPIQRPANILGRPTEWHRVKPERIYGHAEYRPNGIALRITILERTLIDAISDPHLSGGIANVLTAWVRARYLINVKTLIELTERTGVKLTRARIGYLLEQLQLTHPILETWSQQTTRGSSNILVPGAPFSSIYSERWNLSLNGPVHLLEDTE
jgi:predicted transcriptional regulator of viral defense system